MTHCHLNIFKSELGKMTSVGEDVGKFEPLYIAGRNEKWFSRYGKQFGGSSKSETVTYDPAIPLVGICPKELKAGTQTSPYTQMFTAAIITVVKNKMETIQMSKNG